MTGKTGKFTQKRVHAFQWNVACRQMSGHGRNLLTFDFEPDPDYSPSLLSPILYKRCYAEFYVGEIPARRYRSSGFKMVVFTEPSEHRCRIIGKCALPSECPSSLCYHGWPQPMTSITHSTDGNKITESQQFHAPKHGCSCWGLTPA